MAAAYSTSVMPLLHVFNFVPSHALCCVNDHLVMLAVENSFINNSHWQDESVNRSTLVKVLINLHTWLDHSEA